MSLPDWNGDKHFLKVIKNVLDFFIFHVPGKDFHYLPTPGTDVTKKVGSQVFLSSRFPTPVTYSSRSLLFRHPLLDVDGKKPRSRGDKIHTTYENRWFK